MKYIIICKIATINKYSDLQIKLNSCDINDKHNYYLYFDEFTQCEL